MAKKQPTKDEFALTVARLCPTPEGAHYDPRDVKRIIDALPDAVLEYLNDPEIDKVMIPGFVAFSKSIRKAWTSHLHGKETHYPDTTQVKASISGGMRAGFRAGGK